MVSEDFLEAEVVVEDVRFERVLGRREGDDVVLASGEECGVGSRMAEEFRGVGGGEFL